MKIQINVPKKKISQEEQENTFSADRILTGYFQTIARLGTSRDIWHYKNGPCKKDRENKNCSEPECQVRNGEGPLIIAAGEIFPNAWGLDTSWKKLVFKL